jgi:hypothetical protein
MLPLFQLRKLGIHVPADLGGQKWANFRTNKTTLRLKKQLITTNFLPDATDKVALGLGTTNLLVILLLFLPVSEFSIYV